MAVAAVVGALFIPAQSATAISWPSAHWYTVELNLHPNGVNYCLDADANHLGNGDHVQLWTCNGRSNQRWYYTDWSNGIPVYINGDTASTQYYCLDVAGGASSGLANGDQMIIWGCSGNNRQAWSDPTTNDAHGIYNTMIPHPWCVDAAANNISNGDKIQTWTCNGEGQQSWELIYH